MAISTDQAHVTINFRFQSDESPDLSYFVRYHTLDGVPIVSLSEDNENWLNFPASLFSEVTDFLRQNGAMESKTAKTATKQVNKLSFSAFATSKLPSDHPTGGNGQGLGSGSLPLPKVERKGGDKDEMAMLAEPANMPPLETLGSIDALSSRVAKTRKPTPEEEEEMRSRPVVRGDADEAKMYRGETEGGRIKARHSG